MSLPRSRSRGAFLALGIAFVARLSGAAEEGCAVELNFSDLAGFSGTKTVNVATGKFLVVRDGSSGPGVSGAGLTLGGKPDQGIELGVLGFNQPATFAIWIKRAATSVSDPSAATRPEYVQEHDRGQGRLLSRLGGNPSHTLAGALRVGPAGLQLWNGPGWVTLISSPIPAETWVHLAVVFDQDLQATGYLNGKRGETVRSGFDGTPSPMGLFASSHEKHYGYPFAGCVDEVRIYRRALTPEQVAALARMPAGGGGR
jgi:hypothetical protein